MRLWRVSDHLALDGRGGMIVGGRWHSLGRPIVYAAESAALALLEALVQFESRAQLPATYQLLRLDAPEEADVAAWAGAQPSDAMSTSWGDAWLAAGATALARVPASVAPDSFNWLINPTHPAASRIRLTEFGRYPWDERLFA